MDRTAEQQKALDRMGSLFESGQVDQKCSESGWGIALVEQADAFIAFDTLCKVNILSDTVENSMRILNKVRSETLQLQKVLNMYDPDSELSKLVQRIQGGSDLPISPLLTDFLEWNRVFYEFSEGVFDPTVGTLVKLWNFLSEHPKIPSDLEIENERKKVGFHHVQINKLNQTVCFDRTDITIDPGASGKGYALKQAVNILLQEGIRQGVVDFGGNLYVLGGKTAQQNEVESPWRIALIDPDDTENYFGTVSVTNAGLSTSSWYEHSFQLNGTIYHHILDPRNGKPVPLNFKSVTIISNDAAFTDFISTCIFIMGEEAGIQLIRKLRELYRVRIDYIILCSDDTIITSTNDFSVKNDSIRKVRYSN